MHFLRIGVSTGSRRRLPILIAAALSAGCVADRSVPTPRLSVSDPNEPAIATTHSSIAASAKLNEPAPAPSSETHLVRRDAFDIADVAVLTVKREGALFAASSKSPMAVQRPRAKCRVLRTHWEPRDPNNGKAWDDFAVELVQTGLPSIELDEQAVASVATGGERRGLLNGAASQPSVVSTEIVVDKVRVIISADEPDVLTVRSDYGTARYDRRSVIDAFRAARSAIEDMRRATDAAR